MICLQRKNRGDDVIIMTPEEDSVHFTYRDGDRKKGSYKFTLSRDEASSYVYELFISLPRDADPFEFIQVIPCTGPSILYHIWELEEDNLKDIIHDQISRSLCGNVVYSASA
jgi:hypothetical protein